LVRNEASRRDGAGGPWSADASSSLSAFPLSVPRRQRRRLAELRTSLLSLDAVADSPEALLLRHLLLLGAASLVAGVLGRLQICGVGLASQPPRLLAGEPVFAARLIRLPLAGDAPLPFLGCRRWRWLRWTITAFREEIRGE
jgi:hypothetical protein